MDAPNHKPTEQAVRRDRNWWKVAFFVMLVAFEVAREFAVVSMSEGASPNTRANVFLGDGFVTATGTWKRIDDGSSLIPGTVTIECRSVDGQCIEASTTIMDDFVFAPEIDRFPATFTPVAVTYENDIPACAKYSVRIDLALKKAFAIRERKEKVNNPNCAALEPRIEMQLGDGLDVRRDPLEGHFLPILQALAAIS